MSRQDGASRDVHPGSNRWSLNPLCPFSAARTVALKAMVLLLLTLLIKARVRIVAFSALGLLLLLLQTLLFLAVSDGLTLLAGAALFNCNRQRGAAAA